MSDDDRAKLRSLLNYWLKHNQEHQQEFQEWAERAREMGEGTAGEALTTAARDLKLASNSLSRALRILAREEA